MARRIEIRSAHILEKNKRGFSEPKILKRGTPEWKEAVASFMEEDSRRSREITEGIRPKPPKVSGWDTVDVKEAECRICGTHFTYSSPATNPTNRVLCSYKCSRIAKEQQREQRKRETAEKTRLREEEKAKAREEKVQQLRQSEEELHQQNKCLHCHEVKGEERYPEGTFLYGFCSIPCCETYRKELSVCLCCEKPCQFRAKNHKFCSNKCRRIWHKWERNPPLIPVEHECEKCGGAFEKTAHNKRFCSKKCWYAYRREVERVEPDAQDMAPCEGCQTPFLKFPRHKRYCSSDCYTRSRYRKNNPDAYASPETLVCEHCQTQFENHAKGGHPRKFCSVTCRKKFYSKRRSKRSRRKHLNVVCALSGCDQTFDRKGPGSNSRKYCSPECSAEALRRGQRRSQGLPEVIEEEPILCEECFSEFMPPSNQRLRARFCSEDCRLRDRKRTQMRKTREKWRNLCCKHCERTFAAMPTASPRKPPLYCSPRCEEEATEQAKLEKRARDRARYREKLKELHGK